MVQKRGEVKEWLNGLWKLMDELCGKSAVRSLQSASRQQSAISFKGWKQISSCEFKALRRTADCGLPTIP